MSVAESAVRGRDPAFPTFIEDFGPRYLDAWNSHDADRLLDLMTEDIVYDDTASPKTMRGRSDIREFLEYTWRAFPDLRFELIEGPFLHEDGTKATYYWRGFCTHSGVLDPPGVAATGKKVVFEGFDLHEYRDGRLSRLVIVFDMADFMRQLGFLPAVGSRAERAAAVLQRLVSRLSRRR